MPGFQRVQFEEGDEAAALEQANSRDTTLTAFFKLNEQCRRVFDLGEAGPVNLTDSRQFYYHQIPEHFTFTAAAGFKPRAQVSVYARSSF